MAMGYQGLAQIGSQALADAGIDAGYVNLLTTGSSINMALEPIYSTSVWGAGWYNAASTVNYADNVIRYEGGIDFELQASRNAWNLIRDWAIESRAYSRAARITPDGSWVYCYTAADGSIAQNPTDPGTYTAPATSRKGLWSAGLNLNTSTGSFVTASMNCMALERYIFGPGNAAAFGGTLVDPNLTAFTEPGGVSYIQDKFGLQNPNNPLNPGGNNYDPIPYWRTEAFLKIYDGSAWQRIQIGPDAQHLVDTETVEWSADLTNNTMLLFTCRGVRGASAVLQGPIDVTGSVTLYNVFGVFDPVFGAPGITSNGTTWVPGNPSPFTPEAPCFYAGITEFVVRITGANVFVVLPAVVIESDDYGVKAQGDVTNRTFSLKGLGGRYMNSTGTPSGTIPLDSAITYAPNFSTGLTNIALPPMIMTKAL